MRKLQFTDAKGNKTILEHEKAMEIMHRLVNTEITKEAMIAGITFIADGGEYNLLD